MSVVGLESGLVAVFDGHGAVEKVFVDEIQRVDGDWLDRKPEHGATA